METTQKAVKAYPQHKALINAVIAQLGAEDDELPGLLSDIRSHGADTGWSGFTYYSDTVKFAEKNRAKIVALLEEQAKDFGAEVAEMVAGFGVFCRDKMDDDARRDLYRFLSGTKCKETTIPNLMAWYALEEVARMHE